MTFELIEAFLENHCEIQTKIDEVGRDNGELRCSLFIEI